MSLLATIGLGFGVLITIVFLAIQYGKSQTREKQAEKDNEKLKENADVASSDYTDNPVDGL